MAKYKKIKSNQPYHLGNNILKLIEEKGISKSEFGRLLDMSRQNVQSVLTRADMDTELLFNISKALKYDFFKEISNELKKNKD